MAQWGQEIPGATVTLEDMGGKGGGGGGSMYSDPWAMALMAAMGLAGGLGGKSAAGGQKFRQQTTMPEWLQPQYSEALGNLRDTGAQPRGQALQNVIGARPQSAPLAPMNVGPSGHPSSGGGGLPAASPLDPTQAGNPQQGGAPAPFQTEGGAQGVGGNIGAGGPGQNMMGGFDSPLSVGGGGGSPIAGQQIPMPDNQIGRMPGQMGPEIPGATSTLSGPEGGGMMGNVNWMDALKKAGLGLLLGGPAGAVAGGGGSIGQDMWQGRGGVGGKGGGGGGSKVADTQNLLY